MCYHILSLKGECVNYIYCPDLRGKLSNFIWEDKSEKYYKGQTYIHIWIIPHVNDGKVELCIKQVIVHVQNDKKNTGDAISNNPTQSLLAISETQRAWPDLSLDIFKCGSESNLLSSLLKPFLKNLWATAALPNHQTSLTSLNPKHIKFSNDFKATR